MLNHFLDRLIQIGRLTVIGPDGATTSFGASSADEAQPDVTIRLKGILTPLKLALNPDLYLGEAYMDGSLVIEQGTLWDFLDLCGRNLAHKGQAGRTRIAQAATAVMQRFQQYNSIGAARRNVAHHYDLSRQLYEQFLDGDLQYSCAYFRDPTMSLDAAQEAKKRHIASKLLLQPGHRVLDIGCGWGGLALSLARMETVQVVGVTLSEAQLAVARERARQSGLESRVTFELCDYRNLNGKFDRIVSVGMFEHVGTPNYSEFFDTVFRLLADDGIAVIHSISRKDRPDQTSAWTRKYIFPGGHLPALSEVLPAIERTGLWVADLEILRLHYAQTLRHWRERFLANQRALSEIYDGRFQRMWEFYLASSEMGFRHCGLMVFQAQLARQIDAVPLTRDYMFELENVPEAIAAE